MTPRKIRKVYKSKHTIEGAGVNLFRVFGFREVPLFDPFLLLDDFRSDDPEDYFRGFPWHPHRGIETITYVLAGNVEHRDSLGNKGVIGPGDVQWMTAGSGIIHQEMPEGDEQGKMHGFQLWLNLPSQEKMTNPAYGEIKSSDIPEIKKKNGIIIKIISGKIDGVTGPVIRVPTDPEFLDVFIPPGTKFSHRVKKEYTVFTYVIQGRGDFCMNQDPYSYESEGSKYSEIIRKTFIENRMLVHYGEGDEVTVLTEDESVRFLLISGKPLEEPVAWHGPIVMNTGDELRVAFEEYNKGTFIKHPG